MIFLDINDIICKMVVMNEINGGDYVIEKGIPIFSKMEKNHYPFYKLDIGDSFLIPGGKEKRQSISVAITYAQRKLSRKFSSRAIDGDVRVWRVA